METHDVDAGVVDRKWSQEFHTGVGDQGRVNRLRRQDVYIGADMV